MQAEDGLVQRLEDMSAEAARIGSPFYTRLCALLARDVADGGPTVDVLGPTMRYPHEDYHVFRMLAGVHWLVLEEKIPALAAHYASVGGASDPDAAWPHLRTLLEDPPREITAMMGHAIQTNEPARAAAFVIGFLEIAAQTGLPLDLLELGASAGLNLHADRFRFEAGGRGLGPVDAPVRLADHWQGTLPDFDTSLVIESREGCDLMPIDLRQPSERTRLLAYVWPDETSRYALNRAAVETATQDHVTIDQADAADWIEEKLSPGPRPGRATVVYHSLFWLYLGDEERDRITAAIEGAGAKATADAPVAWLSYEQEDRDESRCDLRLRLWPGGEERLLAIGSHHDTPLTVFE